MPCLCVSETTSTDAVLARAPSARHAVSQISCNVARTVSETTSTDAVLARAPSARHAVSQISCNVARTVSETTSTDAVLARAPSARHAVSQISCNVARTPFQRLTAVSIATFLLPRHDPPPLPHSPRPQCIQTLFNIPFCHYVDNRSGPGQRQHPGKNGGKK